MQSLEDPFKNAHRQARPDFQDLFQQDPESRPMSTVKLFRFFRQSDDAIYGFVRGVYKKMTSQILPKSRLWLLFQHVPDWPLFLAGWGHEMFARAISETKYGLRGKPGNLDLWSAGYLPYCDVFVTNDTGGMEGRGRGGQYRALRLLNALIPRSGVKPTKTRVTTFQIFRQELL